MKNKTMSLLSTLIFLSLISSPTFAYNGYHYWPSHSSLRFGFFPTYHERIIVVPEPVQTRTVYVERPAQEEEPIVLTMPTTTTSTKKFIVNIPNKKKNGYCSVTITKTKSGYLGPQGEFYPDFPAVDQLQEMYAK